MDNDVVACAVLSGNRNFEARIHPAVRASFLASPPLVVAFALAGRVDIDLDREPLGHDDDRTSRCICEDVWPTAEELQSALEIAANPGVLSRDLFRRHRDEEPAVERHPAGDRRDVPVGKRFELHQGAAVPRGIAAEIDAARHQRARARSRSSATRSRPTTSARSAASRARRRRDSICRSLGVAPADFNNYGARRMNHEVMMRGTFANVRLKNLMVPGVEGGVTAHQPGGEQMTHLRSGDGLCRGRRAAHRHRGRGIRHRQRARLGGERHAAPGRARGRRRQLRAHPPQQPRRHGRAAVPARRPAPTAATLGLDGTETYDLVGLDDDAKPRQALTLVVHRANGTTDEGAGDAAARYAGRDRLRAARRDHALRARGDYEGHEGGGGMKPENVDCEERSDEAIPGSRLIATGTSNALVGFAAFAGIARSASCSRACAPAAQTYPVKPDPRHQSLQPRRLARPRRAGAREDDDRRARTERRRGEQAGRGRQHRRRDRGEGAARRLHAARGAEQPHDQSRAPETGAVRPGEGFRADLEDLLVHVLPGRPSVDAGALGASS